MFAWRLGEIMAAMTVVPLVVGLCLLAIILAIRPERTERLVTSIVTAALGVAALASWYTAGYLLISGEAFLPIAKLTLTTMAQHSLYLVLQIDRLAMAFVVATNSLGFMVAVFSTKYLWRDPGHGRFFFLVLLFTLGMMTIVTGSSLEVIFVGWEIIGLCSALLISFFFARSTTSDSALKAFWAYRLSDTALLVAALVGGEFYFEAQGAAPVLLTGTSGAIFPLLIILAAGPKSAQVPFSSWLPRAMEGPTPSSAIFYGGLSVHAGLYLALRTSDHFVMPWWFSCALIAMGTATAAYGSLLQRVQTDIKGLLSYASMAQVGIMFIEVGLGLKWLAVVHFVGHATLRTYQILSAGSLLHEGKLRRLAERTRSSQGRIYSKLYAHAFEWSVRDSAGPYSLLSGIESISRRLVILEERFATHVSGWIQKLARVVVG